MISKKKKKTKKLVGIIPPHTQKRAGSIDEILIFSKKKKEKRRVEQTEVGILRIIPEQKSQYGKDINDVRFIIHTHAIFKKIYSKGGKEMKNNNK